jgi:hypothetical protein
MGWHIGNLTGESLAAHLGFLLGTPGKPTRRLPVGEAASELTEV